MKLETKFSQNNLVTYKFENETDELVCLYEVQEVIINANNIGTDIQYLCRLIQLSRGFKKGKWKISHGVGKDINDHGYKRMRENELIECPQHIIDIVLNGGNEPEKGVQ